MSIEAWGILVGAAVAVALAVGPWMASVHAKLAVIAAKIVDLCEKMDETPDENRRHWETIARHEVRLDVHDVAITRLEGNKSSKETKGSSEKR